MTRDYIAGILYSVESLPLGFEQVAIDCRDGHHHSQDQAVDKRELQELDFVQDECGKHGTHESAYESDPGLLRRNRWEEFLRETLAQGYSESESPHISALDYDEEAEQEVTAEIACLVEGDEVAQRDRNRYIKESGVDVGKLPIFLLVLDIE